MKRTTLLLILSLPILNYGGAAGRGHTAGPTASAPEGNITPTASRPGGTPGGSDERLHNQMKTRSQYVVMRDGVKIAVDIVLPGELGKDERIPALLDITRYWRLQQGGVPDATDRFFVSHGYAMVLVDERGTGASFGVWSSPFAREAIKDDGELVDWIVAQPWSNGKVGAIGISYEGGTAQLVPVSNRPAVRAVIPRFEEFDNYTDIAFPGGIFGEWQIKQWEQAIRQLDNTPGVKPADEDRDLGLLKQPARERGKNLDVYQAARQIIYRDDRPDKMGQSIDDFSLHSFRGEIERSGAAIYGWGSWLDAATSDGVIHRYLTFSNPQRVIIGPWNHGGFQNADPYASPFTPNYPQIAECLRYFDYYLKGVENGAGPPREIIYFTMGDERWKSTTVWPPAGTRMERWRLTEDHGLSRSAPGSNSGVDTYKVDFSATTGAQNRWHTEVDDGPVIYPDRAESDRRLLTYTSAPLSEDVEITGAPVADLYVASTHTDGAFFVYLEDVDQGGVVTYLTEGELRALHRKVSDDAPPYKVLTPYHTFKRKDSRPLVPGEIAELKFGLISTSVLIRKGHRIRVAIAGADKDTFARVPEDGTPVITVLRDRQHISSIELPVIPLTGRDRNVVDPWPGLGLPASSQRPDESATQAAVSRPLPSAAEIIDRYVDALGGRAAIERLKTQVARGIRVAADGVTESMETYWKYTDKTLTIRRGAGLWLLGFNGLVKWTQNPYEGLRTLKDPDAPGDDNKWGLQAPIHLREMYSELKVVGLDRVGERPAYLLLAVDSKGNPVRMYFDTRTGLLIRKDAKLRVRSITLNENGAAMSRFLFADGETYFDDYRTVDGVKSAFLRNINIGPPQNQSRKTTERFFEIRNNVPIDASKFDQPGASSGPLGPQ